MNKVMAVSAAIVVVVAVIVLFVIYKPSPTGNATTDYVVANKVKSFTLDAVRFNYTPSTITVNKGDSVIININNIDTKHGIRIPDFGVADENKVAFVANKSGEFKFYCTVFCGERHKEMSGTLIVKELS